MLVYQRRGRTRECGASGVAVLDRAQYGGNEDGEISRADSAFYQLLLWTDRNHDAFSQGSEIESLSTSDIETIELSHVENANLLGNRSAAITDTSAFATCP